MGAPSGKSVEKLHFLPPGLKTTSYPVPVYQYTVRLHKRCLSAFPTLPALRQNTRNWYQNFECHHD